MNITITTISDMLILTGSIFMAVLPFVMSGSSTSPVEWSFIHFKIGSHTCKNITYMRYWGFSWALIIIGTIIQLSISLCSSFQVLL